MTWDNLDPVAIWGAALSTFLLALRLWELWRNRTRIEVSFNFTSDSEEGNAVIIRNLSPTPIIIVYWGLKWRRWRWFPRKSDKDIEPDGWDFEDIVLGAHASWKLMFRGMDHFEWSEKSRGTDSIYLMLRLAGKSRAVVRRVYPLKVFD